MVGRLLSNGLTFLLIIVATLALPAASLAAEVTFVLVNDIDKVTGARERGGFARLAAVVKRERAERKNVVFVHAGDSISPSLLSGFDKGAHIIELLNMVRPDIFVPGNHEFDFGKDVFLKRMAELEVPKLAANLRAADGSKLAGFEDTRILDINGVKIGIIGVSSDDAKVKSSPGDLQLSDAVKAAFEARRKLKEAGAEFFVVVGHTHRGEDNALFRSGAFDMILSGDDHDLLLRYDGRSLLAESGENAHFVTAIDVAIDVSEKDDRKRVSWHPNFRVIDTAKIPPDAQVAARADGFRKTLAAELDVVIGRTETELDSRRAAVRSGEAAIGNLIADAMRAATSAEIAITNGGGIRGNRVYAAGTPLTRRDILTELPFGNRTVLVEVTGEQLKAILENGVSKVPERAGRFPQVSGFTFTYDPSRAAGDRVIAMEIGGGPADAAKTYRLATNDFMARGGDGYTILRRVKSVRGARHSKLLANDVMVYVRAKGSIKTRTNDRITEATSPAARK